jgi:hypothetical protein
MTPRQVRRAAERKANKQARKANQFTTQIAPANPTSVPTPAAEPVEAAAANPSAAMPTPRPISEAKLAANQANAQLSTGPRTDIGKQTSSKNALKTGLTGQTVLLPTDHLPAYEALIARFQKKYNPANPEETKLVQSIIDTTWRLERITNLDFAIFAMGAVELADEFPDLDPATRAQVIQAQTYLKYEKQLRNLHTQEARLQRLLNKETAELQRLQSERLQMEAQLQAFRAAKAAKNQPSKTAATEFGFEFESFANLDANLTAAAPNAPVEQSF